MTGAPSFRRLWRRRASLTPVSPRRGRPRLLRHGDGRLRCTACGLCAAACPSDCLRVTAGPPAGQAPASCLRTAARFDLDLGRCILCGLCVEACPVDAIDLGGDLPTHAFARQALWLNRDALSAD